MVTGAATGTSDRFHVALPSLRQGKSHSYRLVCQPRFRNLQPHFWVCAECGWRTEDLIDSCPTCGNRIWGKVNRVEHREAGNVGSDYTSIPKDPDTIASYLKLVSDLVNSIECGACNSIIYKPEGKFDQDVLAANTKKHYVESPSCKPSLPKPARPAK